MTEQVNETVETVEQVEAETTQETTEKVEESKQEESKQEESKDSIDLDTIESESDTDEDGEQKTVPVQRVKAMAKQAKKLNSKISSLEQQLESSTPIYDVDLIREHIGSPDKFKSTDDYDAAITGYVNQLIADQVNHNVRKSNALSNMVHLARQSGVDLSKMPGMNEENLLLTAESPAAAHIANMLMNNEELATAYSSASPDEVRDFIKQTEGNLQSNHEQAIKAQQAQANEAERNFISGIESLTGGRLNQKEIGKLQVPAIVNEMAQYMKGGQHVAIYLYDKPQALERMNEISKLSPYAALVELGRLEGKAMLYAKSNEFKKKYPKSSSFEADKTLKGGATAPKGLNVNDDAVFNKRFNQLKNRKH